MAGSGKTHIAIGMALEYLLDEKVKKIVITRPVVESGEKIGYLPGSAEEKLHPYLLPLLDEVNHFISSSQFATLKLNNKIDLANEDHCGPCGKYIIDKIKITKIKRK